MIDEALDRKAEGGEAGGGEWRWREVEEEVEGEEEEGGEEGEGRAPHDFVESPNGEVDKEKKLKKEFILIS